MAYELVVRHGLKDDSIYVRLILADGTSNWYSPDTGEIIPDAELPPCSFNETVSIEHRDRSRSYGALWVSNLISTYPNYVFVTATGKWICLKSGKDLTGYGEVFNDNPTYYGYPLEFVRNIFDD